METDDGATDSGGMLRVRELRDARGWTLQELADRLETSAATVHKIETGKTWIGRDMLRRLCVALDVEPHEVFASAKPETADEAELKALLRGATPDDVREVLSFWRWRRAQRRDT